MTNSELPDDLSLWPKDPVRILGVGYDADELTLKRAYTRLIRRFKPEHFPEHFQRIRAAFDLLKERGQYLADFDEAEPDTNDESSTTTQPDAPTRQKQSAVPPVAPVAPPRERPTPLNPEQLQRRAWKLARNGQAAEGYFQLKSQVDAGAADEDLYLRLYWLLLLFPDVDPQHVPNDWLLSGLQSRVRFSRLLELFQREAEREPELAFHPDVEKLLTTGSVEMLPSIVEARWLAAITRGTESAIITDLDILRKRLAFDHQVAWCRLLFTAIRFGILVEQLWFGRLQDVIDELEQTASLHHELKYDLDQLEQLVHLAEGWSETQNAPCGIPAWLDVIRRSWFQPYDALLPQVHRVVAGIAAAPVAALEQLYGLYRLNPVAAERLLELLRYYCNELQADTDDESQIPSLLCGALLERHMYANDVELRKEILHVALQEFVEPSIVAQHIPAERFLDEDVWRSLEEVIRDDFLLHAVYRAVRTFWR